MEKIKVFISYAWEPDPFRNEVAKLASWLSNKGANKITVTTDHLYTNRAPKEGWPVWMANQIESSDVVLVVCSPLYLDRFNKKERSADRGRGVIYEGTIITQSIYNAQAINEKIFPIIPDGGSVDHVPIILQAFFNGQSFPSNYEGILKLILNENPTYEDLLKHFFEASSVDANAKEAIAEVVGEKIIQEIEKEILKTIIDPSVKKEKGMISSIQETIRAYLTLSDIDRVGIIYLLKLDSEISNINTVERDKHFFQIINKKKLLNELWNQIHIIKPFSHSNPFTK